MLNNRLLIVQLLRGHVFLPRSLSLSLLTTKLIFQSIFESTQLAQCVPISLSPLISVSHLYNPPSLSPSLTLSVRSPQGLAPLGAAIGQRSAGSALSPPIPTIKKKKSIKI